MTLDPTLAAILARTAEAGRRPARTGTTQQARDALAARAAPGAREMDVTDAAVPHEGREVPVRVYTPEDVHGVVVYFHGGGWVTGSVDTADAVARELAAAVGAIVVSVDYALSPEARFPVAVGEAIAAVRWAGARYAGERVAVAGESSGGNLAAVAAHALRSAGWEEGVAVIAAALFYPAVDYAPDRPSFHETSEVPLLLDGPDMLWFWDQYLPDEALRTRPDAAPLRAADLSVAPPTILVLAGHDPLRDEGLAYAAALSAAGVPVEQHLHPALCHGFLAFLGLVPVVGETVTAVGRALAGHLHPTAAGAARDT